MDETITQKKPIFDLSALNLPDLTDASSSGINAEQQPGEKFIVFFLGDKLFGVSSAQVAEVTHPLTVTPLPNAAGWLSGIANLRGEVITVIDLQKILENFNSALMPKSKFVVARWSKSAPSIAFTVDKLSELVTLSKDEITPVENGERDYMFGSAVYKANTLQLIDLKKLAASLEEV